MAPNIDHLLAQFTAEEPSDRYDAARAVAAFGLPVVPQLLALIRQGAKRVSNSDQQDALQRIANTAAIALTAMDETIATPVIIEQLQDSDQYVRSTIADWLFDYHDEQLTPILQTYLSDPNRSVR